MARRKKAAGGKGDWRAFVRDAARVAALCLIFILVLLLVGSIALSEGCQSFFDGNRYAIWLPKNVSDYFAGERINLDFLLPTGKVLSLHGIVDRGWIGPLSCGSPYEHDYFVSMTWIEAVQLATSEKPITTFRSLWDNGKIIVSPKGLDKMEKLQGGKAVLVEDGEPVPADIREYFAKYSDRGQAIEIAKQYGG